MDFSTRLLLLTPSRLAGSDNNVLPSYNSKLMGRDMHLLLYTSDVIKVVRVQTIMCLKMVNKWVMQCVSYQ